MLIYVKNNVFKRLLTKCDRCRMSFAKYSFDYKSEYETGIIWVNLCDDCIRKVKKRKPVTPEAKSLFATAERLKPKTVVIF